MTIYTIQGFVSSKVTPVDTFLKPFDYIANIQPLEVPNVVYTSDENLKKFKSTKAPYFISGNIAISENGEYIINKANLLYRDLIAVDMDNIPVDQTEAIYILTEALQGYKYIIYNTIKHTYDKPRLRLILEPSRNILLDEYQPTLDALQQLLPFKLDKNAMKWHQLAGLPIYRKGTEAVFIKQLEGKTFEVVEAPQVKEAVKFGKQPQTNNKHDEQLIINDDDFYQIFIEYLKVDYINLYDNENTYDRCLSVILALARAVTSEEISYNIALECIELLATQDPNCQNDYIDNNISKLNHAITTFKNDNSYFTANPKSYTFWQKIRATKDKKLIFLVKQKLNSEITSNSELYYRLENIGQQWREENTTVNEKTGVEKVPLMAHYTIANKLYKLLPCKYGGYDEQTALLYFYDFDKGIYTPNEDILKKAIIRLEYRYKLDNVKSIVEGLKTKLQFERPVRKPDKIAVGNGIFNLKTKQLEPFNPNHFITAKVDTNYNPLAVKNYNKIKDTIFNIDNWLNEIACNDSEVVTLFWQLINEAVNPNKTRRKIAIMYGNGKNGKSTFQSFIVNLIGANNVSSITPHEIQQRFGVGGLEGKICNYADEIGTKPLDEVDKIKSIASGEVIAYERKNKDVRYYDFKTLLMFNSNQLPTIKEKSDAVLERMLIIPFNADFKGKEDAAIKESKLNNKIILEYALYKALNLEFEKFTIPKVVSDMVEEYKKDNDSLHAYLLDYIDRNLHHISRIPVYILSADYENFCRENGYNLIKRPVKKVEERLNKTFSNATYKYVVKNEKYSVQHLEELKRFDLLGKYLVETLKDGDVKKSLSQQVKK